LEPTVEKKSVSLVGANAASDGLAGFENPHPYAVTVEMECAGKAGYPGTDDGNWAAHENGSLAGG